MWFILKKLILIIKIKEKKKQINKSFVYIINDYNNYKYSWGKNDDMVTTHWETKIPKIFFYKIFNVRIKITCINVVSFCFVLFFFNLFLN